MEDLSALGARFGVTTRCHVREGPNSRGLFIQSPSGPEGLLAAIPLGSALFVVEPAADPEAQRLVDAAFQRWKVVHGAQPPPGVMGLLRREWPKDWRLAVGLLWARKNAPLWKEYAEQCLPSAADLPSLHFASDSERAELQDDEAAMLARDVAGLGAKAWDALMESGVLAELPDVREADLLWALAIVHTRGFGFSVPPGLQAAALAPFLDMANHSFSPNSACVYDPATEALQLVWDAPTASNSIPAVGTEVLLSYGSTLPNAVLAAKYGFVDPGNPNAQLPADLATMAMGRLQRWPIEEAIRAVHYHSVDPERLPACVGALMRLTRGGPGHPVQADEAIAVRGLFDGLTAHLAAHPTSLEEDRRLMSRSDPPLTARGRTCVEYRLDRKALWTSCVDLLRAWETVVAAKTPTG